ncbi:MAG: MFS transporter [Pseudomonadota bacterium]
MSTSSSRNSFLFFSALLFSAFGYEFIFFIMTLHVYDLSRNPLNIGIFTALTFIPRLFSSIMGGIADKLGKGRCLAFSAGIVSILLFIMSCTSDIGQIYTIWFMTAIFLTFIVNARSGLMAEIVSREKYTSGNAVVLTLLNGAKLLGPLLGGFIISLYHTRLLIYFTCVIYLLAAAFSIRIKAVSIEASNKTGFLDNAGRGFSFMLKNHAFGLMSAIAFFWRLFLALQLSLFVIYIKTCLSGSSEQYGVFMTVLGLGSIAGSLLGPYAAGHLSIKRLITSGLGLHYLSFAALGFSKSYFLSLCIIFLSYTVFYLTLVGMHSLRDRITYLDIRSSAYGTVTAVLTPAAIISMLAGGYLADSFGAAAVLSGAGLLAFLSLCILLFIGRKVDMSMTSLPAAENSESA